MTTEQIKQKKGARPVYFKGLGLEGFDINLNKREVTMAWNAFGAKDDDKDIILKGAFSKSISERGPGSSTYRKIAYLKFHNYSLPIGPVKKIWEDDRYLVAKAVIDPTPEGDQSVVQYQTGTLNQHSIGYRYIWDKGQYSENDDAFIWKEIDLWEGSAVVSGANENTPLLEMHGLSKEGRITEAMDSLEKLLKNIEIKNQYELRKNISMLLALSNSKEPGKPLERKKEPQTETIDYAMVALAISNSNKSK